ncbi:hypothetical protein [Streptomyces sp. NPDC059881]|uniref:hypothetical protein n=1 Tax=Streptomyces sp. NPDC059881 TaxID=3346986 RepID=UPI00365E02A3
MRMVNRHLGAGILAVAAIAGSALATSASQATAASYRCKTSSASIDTANYSGPTNDQWNVTTTLCAKRTGSSVYAYAKISWDGPVFMDVDNAAIFDSARFRLQVKRSQSGTDPVVVQRDYYAIESRLENSNSVGNYNGSYQTPTVRWSAAGRSKAVVDGVLQLDWHRCCGGYKSHSFSASPVV